MTNEFYGDDLLAEHQELEVRLMQSGREGLLKLIESCIECGWDTEDAILAKVQQIGGPYYDHEVPKLLAVHASPLARPQRWQRTESGRYSLTGPAWDPRKLEFWKPAGARS